AIAVSNQDRRRAHSEQLGARARRDQRGAAIERVLAASRDRVSKAQGAQSTADLPSFAAGPLAFGEGVLNGTFVGAAANPVRAGADAALHFLSDGAMGRPYDVALPFWQGRTAQIAEQYPDTTTLGTLAGFGASTAAGLHAANALAKGGNVMTSQRAGQALMAGPTAMIQPGTTTAGNVARFGAGSGAEMAALQQIQGKPIGDETVDAAAIGGLLGMFMPQAKVQ
ncbi:MAG: hypothetical protein AAGF32_08925, partial [Pseudomonadota bacterium]